MGAGPTLAIIGTNDKQHSSSLVLHNKMHVLLTGLCCAYNMASTKRDIINCILNTDHSIEAR